MDPQDVNASIAVPFSALPDLEQVFGRADVTGGGSSDKDPEAQFLARRGVASATIASGLTVGCRSMPRVSPRRAKLLIPG